jgi:uncharacterized repeat protein (TIGR01451 family)
MASPTLFLSMAAIALAARSAWSTEVTVKNDSLTNNTSGVIEAGFVSGEKAAAWLTSPCAGNIVAAQVLWRSATGNATQVIEDSLDIYRPGSFPVPGMLAQNIGAPILNDGVVNEYRYLDQNSTIPLSVPVNQNETFILALTFANAPDPTGPSVVRDSDGIQPNRNAIYADLGGGAFAWLSNTALGVNGDWVIRAVVDCPVVSQNADVAVTMTALPALYTAGGGTLTYTIAVSNAGPAASPNTSIVDIFPQSYTGVSWTCTPTGGAMCTSGTSGSGNIIGAVSLPNAGAVTYSVSGSVTAGTTILLSNTATAVVGSPSSDPNTNNNTATVNTPPLSDRIFANGFEGS